MVNRVWSLFVFRGAVGWMMLYQVTQQNIEHPHSLPSSVTFVVINPDLALGRDLPVITPLSVCVVFTVFTVFTVHSSVHNNNHNHNPKGRVHLIRPRKWSIEGGFPVQS